MPRIPCVRPLVAACVLLSTLFLGGCGYQSLLGPVGGARNTTDARDSEAGREILATSDDHAGRSGDATRRTRLAVVALRNDSPEPWLDRIVTDAMRREMGSRGGFDLVNDPHQADLVLRGRIRPLDNRAESYSSFVAAVQFAITLELDLEVVRRSGDIVRLDRAMLTETDVYQASGDIEVTRSNRLELLRHLSDLLAARVADSLELMSRPIDDSTVSVDG